MTKTTNLLMAETTEMTFRSWCCFIDCDKSAEWVIVYGCAPDDYTESCTEHVGELLTDAPIHTVFPLANRQTNLLTNP